MTQTAIKSAIQYITIPWATATPSLNTTTFVLDAASEKAALIFQATKAGTINKIGFHVGAYTSTATFEVELQTVNASDGFPSGTKVGSSTQATVSVTATGWYEATMATGGAVTRGTLYAVVLQQPSASPGNFNISAAAGVYQTDNNPNCPYGALFTASWAKSARMPSVAVYYDDGTLEYIPGLVPATAVNSHAINTGTTPDEIALRFQVPVACKMGAVAFRMAPGGSTRTYDVILYDNGGTALSTTSFDTDQLSSTSANAVPVLFIESEQTLTANTTYRLALKPTTASNQTFYSFDVNANAILAACDGGIECYWSQRTDGGAWSDTTTRRPLITPILTSFDDGAGTGSGGIKVNPGMSGMING